MGSVHDERAAIPFPSRKSQPCMRRVSRRTRTAVHVDPSFRLSEAAMGPPRNDLLGPRVYFRPPPENRPGKTAVRIRAGVRTALILGNREQGRFPGVSPHTSSFIQRHASIVADFRPGAPLHGIPAIYLSVFAGKIALGEPGDAARKHRRSSRTRSQLAGCSQEIADQCRKCLREVRVIDRQAEK